MKRNLPVTQKEHHYPKEERLISETDLRGIVTTANAAFCAVAGYSQEELTGKNHNIIRHPDMPPLAFEDLWRTIEAGERWSGIVKNRCKNGDHYWVKAFVSPVIMEGRVLRYRSVRRQPTREEIEAAERLYQRINAGEKIPLDTLGALERARSLGDRLGMARQLSLLAGAPLLLMVGLLTGAMAGAPGALLWGLAAAGALVSAGLARLVYRWLTEPLAELARAISAFEQGDLTARAQIPGKDRYAELARVMNRALDGVEVAVSDMGQMLDGLARGEFGRRIVATLPGELGRIKSSANRAADQIESTVNALNSQLATLADGHLGVDRQALGGNAEGKFREAQENARIAATRLATLLRELVTSSQALATGDLTYPVHTQALGELADLCSHFNAALASLSETLLNVRTHAHQVSESTDEISRAIEEIAAGASSQMASVEQVSTSVRESGQTIGEIATHTGFASAKSRETVETVRAGRAKMERMVQLVQSIAESSERISRITGVIEGIANKTNLLSLNAAIEAARAGESGRGFAVVAGEVGKLAISAGQSTKEITAIVQEAVAQARQAAASVSEVARDMDRIEAAAHAGSDLMTHIAAAMEQQRATLATIGTHSSNLSVIAESNAAATEELAASASELARVAEATYRETAKFRTQ
ncbi:MAG: methyl-accepting chemotaxis protein [Bacillota bacterium]